ncbi:unnamed protein product [Caenorhabditis bovis]|uniref:protein-tyrosine-phosphatase n=1 Tax=Caenorhabditis bovis TaxID=2654633 RepID=A0A8S1F867_9PELO|nr:unnamed protein product [Caenorhabditis bovis]
MQSTLPSTSHNGEQVTAEQFNRIVSECNENDYLLLDCRSDGEPIKHASRVQLPNVLQRRLIAGSLALSNVSARLQNIDNAPNVIVICGETPSDELISNSLIKLLRQYSFRFVVFSESVRELLASYPDLRGLTDDEMMISSHSSQSSENNYGGPPVGFLNIGSLRLESEHTKPRAEFPVEVSPYLYLGNGETARNREILDKYAITYVINVTSNLPNVFENDPNMHYLRISVDDNSSHNLTKFFQDAFAFIKTAQDNQKGCLVHCLAGISRSVTICLAYLMHNRRVPLEIAYDWLQNKNASIAPNFHFMGQLTDYERLLGLENSCFGTYPSSAPRSPSCSIEAAATAGLLTPPPTSCSASPQSSTHSAKSFH